jgi:hypothetical protein
MQIVHETLSPKYPEQNGQEVWLRHRVPALQVEAPSSNFNFTKNKNKNKSSPGDSHVQPSSESFLVAELCLCDLKGREYLVFCIWEVRFPETLAYLGGLIWAVNVIHAN